MSRQEFLTLLVENKHIEVCHNGHDVQEQMLIRNKETGRFYSIKTPELQNITVEELLDILSGNREPDVLFTVTRIVGYYSKTANWNDSKLGELKDRQAGNYSMGQALPIEVVNEERLEPLEDMKAEAKLELKRA